MWFELATLPKLNLFAFLESDAIPILPPRFHLNKCYLLLKKKTNKSLTVNKTLFYWSSNWYDPNYIIFSKQPCTCTVSHHIWPRFGATYFYRHCIVLCIVFGLPVRVVGGGGGAGGNHSLYKRIRGCAAGVGYVFTSSGSYRKQTF